MKRFTIFLWCALLVGSGAVYAASMTERIDTDGDGKASPKEDAVFWKKWFAETDKNNDGVLVTDEWNHAAFRHMDADHNGELTAKEHAAARVEMFKKHDTNKDGYLTPDEY